MIYNRKYPEFDQEKATEAVSYLLKLHGGRMSRVKVIKLLYLADRKSLQKWERPITYDTYYSMQQGQVLSGVLDLINNVINNAYWNKYIAVDGIYIKLQKKDETAGFHQLTRGEVKLLEDIYKEYGSWWRFALGDLTKTFPEYRKTAGRIKTEWAELLTYMYGEDKANRVAAKLEEKAYLEMAVNK